MSTQQILILEKFVGLFLIGWLESLNLGQHLFMVMYWITYGVQFAGDLCPKMVLSLKKTIPSSPNYFVRDGNEILLSIWAYQ